MLIAVPSRLKPFGPRLAIVVLAAWIGTAGPVCAAVVVVANQSEEEVRFTARAAAERSHNHTLAAGDVLPIPAGGSIIVTFSTQNRTCRYTLEASNVYCFVDTPTGLDLKQIGLTRKRERAEQPAAKAKLTEIPAADATGLLVRLPVKILVDQAEPTVRRVWEARLRRRVREASAILQRQCRLQLEVIEVATWESDPELTTLEALHRDFQQKVALGKARLALGFTSRPRPKEEKTTFGMIAGPLETHILIREWAPRTEADRLEVLLHELGHFLGACGSADNHSVMRATLGDGRANLVAHHIGFDPLNTLVLNLVTEELARGAVRRLDELPAATQGRLLDVYSTVAHASAGDTWAARHLQVLEGEPPTPSLAAGAPPAAVVDGAREVVAAIVAAAERNVRLAEGKPAARLRGDALTAHYFAAGAAAARRLPAEHAVSAYLLGLAVALDRSALLPAMSFRGVAWDKIERAAQRERRLRVLGEPTLHGSSRLAEDFVVSAGLSVLVQGQNVSPAAFVEEMRRVREEDRFRFDDLAAALAGSTFALQLDASPSLLGELTVSFRTRDYVLPPRAGNAVLSHEEFARAYGSIHDDRFRQEEDDLREKLMTLPGYQERSPEKIPSAP